MLAFIVSNSKTTTIFLNGENYSVSTDHPRYMEIVEKLKDWLAMSDNPAVEEERYWIEDELKEILQAGKDPNKALHGHAEIKGGKIFYNGKEVNNVLAERIVQIDMMGLPAEPMLRFMENVMLNPSEDSRNELYDFLAHKNIPITEDGCFLAYKAVSHDYLDKYSRTIDNSPGRIVSVPRSTVDDNRSNECSHGLHVGAVEYVRNYGSGTDDRFVIVKINPRDAVSVPRDHAAQKLRVCCYEVLMEVDSSTILDMPIYSSNGTRYESMKEYDSSQMWDEEDYYHSYEDEEDEYYSRVWDDNGDDEEETGWTDEMRNGFLETAVLHYDSDYDRDNLCRLAAERGACRTIESARQMGKTSVCALLARQDLEKEMELHPCGSCCGCDYCEEEEEEVY